ncbi:hypothetical protein G6F68_019048 [Rhizopus microsporus]|nr:hypothetical protein G6F68_019048 [Rhizopus microsporus]
MGSSQHLELMPQDVYPFMTGQNSSSKQAEKIQSAIKGLEPVCHVEDLVNGVGLTLAQIIHSATCLRPRFCGSPTVYLKSRWPKHQIG